MFYKAFFIASLMFSVSFAGTLKEAQDYANGKVNENLGWIQEKCGFKPQVDMNWPQFSKLDYSKVLTDYPVKDRMPMIIEGAGFISNLEGVFSAVYQNCTTENNKKAFSNIKWIKIAMQNETPKEGQCWNFVKASGVLWAYLHIENRCKGDFVSEQLIKTFSSLGAKTLMQKF